jgi:hypothetical protein
LERERPLRFVGDCLPSGSGSSILLLKQGQIADVSLWVMAVIRGLMKRSFSRIYFEKSNFDHQCFHERPGSIKVSFSVATARCLAPLTDACTVFVYPSIKRRIMDYPKKTGVFPQEKTPVGV